jgi:hypothetical protein
VYDLRTGKKRFVFPTGILSADGRVLVSTVQVKRGTRIMRFDPRTGRAQSLRTLQGTWAVVGVSADGRRVARFKYRRHPRGTILTFDDGPRPQSIRLPGNYQLESFSQDGKRLFLVHWHRTGSYDLQQYDRASGRLGPTRLDEPDEKMSGQAMGAVATRDGRRLLTLYVKPEGGAFVHALDLRTGIAHCIDLPLRGDFATAGTTVLTLSPDESRLYLASPLLGRVTTVDLVKLEVASTARFRRVPLQTYAFGTTLAGAISPNGRMLAFVTQHRLWLVDTAFGVVRDPIRISDGIRGVGFTAQGRRVVAIAGGGRQAFDAATGEPVS